MSEAIKVLFIDDEPDLCEMVKLALEGKGGYSVTTTTDPTAAESLFTQTQPDIVILDNVMPKLSGGDVAKKLKALMTERKFPVIMISGKGEFVYLKKSKEFKWMPNAPAVKTRGPLPDIKNSEELAKHYGVTRYATKPFTVDFLIEAMGEELAKFVVRKKDETDDTQII